MQPYRGGKTTLCAGCGHNAISERIIDAFFEMGIDPEERDQAVGDRLLEQEPGVFPRRRARLQHRPRPDAVGRDRRDAGQPQAAGDRRQRRRRYRRDRHRPVRAPDAPQPADHLHHRGQRLLRPDQGAVLADRRPRLDHQGRDVNDLPPIDTCALAIELGASFVARSFSGDKKQLLSILKAALSHRGTCMIDVLSPCVTFNDHEGSTKSYAYVKEHDEPLGEVSFVPYFDDISIEYEPGTTTEVQAARRLEAVPEEGQRGLQPDRQACGAAAAARDRQARRVRDRRSSTSSRTRRTSSQLLNMVDEPLATLPLERVRPARAALDEFMDAHR